MTTTINAPDPKANGKSWFGPVELEFRDGVASYDGELTDGLRAYLQNSGYGIDADAAPAEAPAPAADSRDHNEPVQINQLRDAAVDPRPEDFMPPVNAGQGDPHGPTVVAPGVHGANQKAVVPGPVGSVTEDDDGKPIVDTSDTDAQQAKESQVAEATLVDGQPVHEAIADAAAIDPINTDQQGAGPFDPAEHNVDEVNDYLASASDAERVRVLAAETDGKARVGVLEGPHATE